MASSWPQVRFGEVCEHSAFGPRFSSDEYAPDGNVACLRTTDFLSDGRIDLNSMPLAKLDLDRFSSHILQRNDLVITRTGAYLGKVAVFDEFRLPVLPGAFSIRFRLNRRLVDPQFVRYFFGSPDGQISIQSIATGSAQPNLNITNLHGLQLPLPPINVQRRIVEILGALDAKIELNRRTNRTLESMAGVLFKSWFIDFDPVRANAAGRKPAEQNTDVAALFPDRFLGSRLGAIPAGWNVARIDEIAAINDWTLGKNEQLDVIDYVEISEVMRGEIGNLPRYSRGDEPSRARRRLRHGDMVLSTVRPDRGAYFLCQNPSETLIASTGFVVLSPTKVPWSWLACAVTGNGISEYLGHHADGGAYPAVNPNYSRPLAYSHGGWCGP